MAKHEVMYLPMLPVNLQPDRAIANMPSVCDLRSRFSSRGLRRLSESQMPLRIAANDQKPGFVGFGLRPPPTQWDFSTHQANNSNGWVGVVCLVSESELPLNVLMA